MSLVHLEDEGQLGTSRAAVPCLLLVLGFDHEGLKNRVTVVVEREQLRADGIALNTPGGFQSRARNCGNDKNISNDIF
jgi:hypothetical protein